MKKMILLLISQLPFSSLSMAASMKLNELTYTEKVQLINDVVSKNPFISIEEINEKSDIDEAVNVLVKKGYISVNAKSTGAESGGNR